MESQNDDLLDMDYQYKQYNADHFEKMAEVQAGSPFLHSKVSPYSILRLSAQEDVDGTIQEMTMRTGPRSTRAQLLR